MTKLTTTLLASGITLMSVTPTFAQLGTNLLANPDAETKLDGEWEVWTGNLDREDIYGNIFPHKGNYFFRLRYTAKITQDIEVSNHAFLIDSGKAKVKVGAWFIREYGNHECFFRFQYYGENASYLTEESETFNCNVSDWTEQQVIKTIPPFTRTITFEMRKVTSGGHYIYFDDAYLQILDGTIVEQPCSPPQSKQACGADGCAWSSLPEPPTDDECSYIPIDRFRASDGNLWHNPVRFEPSGIFPHSDGTQYDATQFAPGAYQNAIEGFFQIRHACQASWYSGAKDLGWIPANVVGAIQYCVYPENIPEVVNYLRAVADQLACENDLPECNQ